MLLPFPPGVHREPAPSRTAFSRKAGFVKQQKRLVHKLSLNIPQVQAFSCVFLTQLALLGKACSGVGLPGPGALLGPPSYSCSEPAGRATERDYE